MHSILQQLYAGKIYPEENFICENPEAIEKNRMVAEEKARFVKNLSESDHANFLKLDDLMDESASLYGYERFAQGFKLATSLLLESLSGKESTSM